MGHNVSSDILVNTLKETIVAMVCRDDPDLSARQLAVFLTCYLRDEAYTVRGLAQVLNVSKPAITRALDRLSELDLVQRAVDPMDRRSVLVQRTVRGAKYLHDIQSVLEESFGSVCEHSKASSPRKAPVQPLKVASSGRKRAR